MHHVDWSHAPTRVRFCIGRQLPAVASNYYILSGGTVNDFVHKYFYTFNENWLNTGTQFTPQLIKIPQSEKTKY